MAITPIVFQDKVNSPELLALLLQFGMETYLSADDVNAIKAAINALIKAGTIIQTTQEVSATSTPIFNNNITNVLLFKNSRTFTLPNQAGDYNFNAVVYPGVTITLGYSSGLTPVFTIPATVTAGQIFTVMKVGNELILRGI
jgi:hypothetical protein